MMLLQLALGARLHLRNKLALLYSYVFPTLFLLVFYVLYRDDQVPLVRHIGALLTVTVLGGACFGLPTSLVSERERGVWRRYRLAPVTTGTVVGSTLIVRYGLLLVAGLLQLALAIALGMPAPRHPVDLWIAFTCVAWAFLGLGLVIAMLANSVPAVQALGQCLFLPLLIIGGIAVPLASLPAWAQHVADFFPGRYAVDAINAAVAGPGLRSVQFSVAALLAIGASGTLAGAMLFRWDTQQRVASARSTGWVAVALAAWVAIGLVSHGQRRVLPDSPHAAGASPAPSPVPAQEPNVVQPEPRLSPQEKAVVPAMPPKSTARPAPRAPVTPVSPSTWQAVTRNDIDRDLVFEQLPPDSGIVTPIAEKGEAPDPNQADLLDHIRRTLAVWQPGQVADPVQRARNALYVAGVADIQQLTLERHIPLVVFDNLRTEITQQDLIRILYWIAMHPDEGSVTALKELRAFRLDAGPIDVAEVRNRAAIYAAKLLHRLIAAG